MPQNPQCTFSPTALKSYLRYPSVVTHHLENLEIVTSTGSKITLPSLPRLVRGKLLDYHHVNVVRFQDSHTIVLPIGNGATHGGSFTKLSRALIHQRLAHLGDDKLDIMCRKQIMIGLPSKPFPRSNHICSICTAGKFAHPPKGHTMDTSSLQRGELLHIDFGFYDTVSIRGFTSELVIIDAKTRILWTFPSSSKRAPLHILRYFFTMLSKDGVTCKTVRIDEDGALARSSEFTTFLRDEAHVTMETTGGYSSFLNGKAERPHRTLANMVRCMLLNSGHKKDKWCYASETAGEIYRYTYHKSIDTSPYFAWYGVSPSIYDLRVWGCVVHVRVPQAKKSDDRTVLGYHMGFTKSDRKSTRLNSSHT